MPVSSSINLREKLYLRIILKLQLQFFYSYHGQIIDIFLSKIICLKINKDCVVVNMSIHSRSVFSIRLSRSIQNHGLTNY